MIVLYGNAISTYCAKVRVVLRHKQVPFEDREPPDGYGSPAYRAIVPMGTIPGFVDGAVVLSESEAIAEYLEETHPEPAMLWGDAGSRARIRSLSRVHDCWIEPQLRALFGHIAPARRDPAVVTQRCAELQRRLREFADYATPAAFIAGARLSLADCAWATTCMQAEMILAALEVDFTLPASLVEWRATLERHPAIAPGLAPCRAAMLAWFSRLNVAAPDPS